MLPVVSPAGSTNSWGVQPSLPGGQRGGTRGNPPVITLSPLMLITSTTLLLQGLTLNPFSCVTA